MKQSSINYLGVGIGLRRDFFKTLFEVPNPPDWLEIIPENFMRFGGEPQRVLKNAKEKIGPITSHGVGLSLGSLDPFNEEYIVLLKKLLNEINAPFFSDHLSFSSVNSHFYHDLIPLPITHQTENHVVDKIKTLCKIFNLPFAIENISYYARPGFSEMDEACFINNILEKADCYLLLDINNVYVNAKNHDFDPEKFIQNINLEKVIQIHLAGHWDRGDVIIDTHGDFICEQVWQLYRKTLQWANRPLSTLIEWDNDIPEIDVVLNEAKKAKKIIQEVFK